MKLKILFDKDKIKLSRVCIYDGSVCGVGFEQDGQKFFIHEGYGEDGEYMALYSVDEHGTRHFIQNDDTDFNGIGVVCDYDDSAINRRYAQWKKKTNVRGHSKKQALRSIPYKQYRLDRFVDMLNRYFGMNAEGIRARDSVAYCIERSIRELETIKATDSYLKPFLKDYPNVCKEINAVIKQLKPIQKMVEATTF